MLKRLAGAAFLCYYEGESGPGRCGMGRAAGAERTIGIGIQDYEQLIRNDYFYIDKTDFIREWWENGDAVTLITRPRRFGKTLTMSMTEKFFSVEYADRGDLFEGKSIWSKDEYRGLQGTYPVIALSFADVKESSFENAREKICHIIMELYDRNRFILESEAVSDRERRSFQEVDPQMSDAIASVSLKSLSLLLSRYYGRKVLILLDEYDTPLQEAYVYGYWEEMAQFTRSLFNSTFKTNPYLERAVMTGITRISKESIFSDLNHLEVVSTTSAKYETSFGFTEEEVFAAMEEYGLSSERGKVKEWYDGFTFGKTRDIYNPWSITNYLEKRQVGAYWANTSSNSLAGKLIREGTWEVKVVMEDLLKGGTLHAQIDEQVVFGQLDSDENAIWSLFLAGGYLKVVKCTFEEESGKWYYDLALTNKEVRVTFDKMIKGWFARASSYYNDFVKALLLGDVEAMNLYMNRVAMATFSFFDTGKEPSGHTEPERFYHGFVLGLMVDLSDCYAITSNRESGFGRYDIVLEPLAGKAAAPNSCGGAMLSRRYGGDAIIIEFKVHSPRDGATLQDTVDAALRQIEEKAYAAGLVAKGIPKERIRRYGFAFEGKEVLIG